MLLARPDPRGAASVENMSASGSPVLRTVAWCAGVLLVGAGLLTAVVVGFGALVGPAEARTDKELDGPAVAAQEFAGLAAADPATALRSCTPARATEFDALAGALRAGAVPAGERYAVVEGSLLFLSAPVTGDGLGAGGGDRAVWAYGRQGFAAVTDGARELSPDLPGPELYGVDARAPGAVRAVACVGAAQHLTGSGGALVQGQGGAVRVPGR